MNIQQSFEVHRPIEAVWGFFQDVPNVASCLPGAELTEDRGGGAYAGKVTVKLGPMSATFEGEAHVTPDHEAMSAHIEGKGTDRRGGSRGQVKVDYHLTPVGDGTNVAIDAALQLSGAAAQFGRTGLIEEMSGRLIGEFVECLHAKLDAGSVEEAAEISAGEVGGVSLFLKSLASWVGKLLKRLVKEAGTLLKRIRDR